MNAFSHLLVIAVISIPWSVQAKRPRGIIATGQIQSIDHMKRRVVMKMSDGSQLHFAYSPWAKFWRGNYSDTPETLMPGMRVQVNLRNPLFGPDVTSQFILISQERKALKR